MAAMLGEASAGVRDVARERRAARGRTGEAPRLVVRDLLIDRQDAGVSFEVQAGEILGMAALEGQGQDRLFEILSGNVRAAGGEILVDGRPVRPGTPMTPSAAGWCWCPATG